MEDLDVGKELVAPEAMEDMTMANELLNMQELSSAPFGPQGMSKEEYAKRL